MRNAEGQLEVFQDVQVNTNDILTFIPIVKGVFVVIGELSDDDEPMLAQLLRELG
jgi:hypothetical protein